MSTSSTQPPPAPPPHSGAQGKHVHFKKEKKREGIESKEGTVEHDWIGPKSSHGVSSSDVVRDCQRGGESIGGQSSRGGGGEGCPGIAEAWGCGGSVLVCGVCVYCSAHD
jgi:hypothetical protein